MDKGDLIYTQGKKRFYNKKHNDYQEKKETRRKYDFENYYNHKSNPNRQLRCTIKSKINVFMNMRNDAEQDFENFYLPMIENKKCMTWWDFSNERRHKIIS
jgi:hypothetical protein